MPPGIPSLASLANEPQAPAFTIINQDNLQTTLPILHIGQMNDDYPKERSRSKAGKISHHFTLANLQNNQVNPLKKRIYSKSHDNLGMVHKKIDESIKSAMSLSTENFTEVLNHKLENVGETYIGKLGSRNKHMRRKPFITTVKSGEFLMPPPEVAALLGIAQNGIGLGHDNGEQNQDEARSKFRLASLGRRPEVRHTKHNERCQAALKATVDFAVKLTNCTTLAHEERVKRLCNSKVMSTGENENQAPFSNIMFDRRVARGSTFATPMLLEAEHCQAKRKQLAKKRSQQQASRSMMLRIKSPPPVPGRKHEPVQTEMYLEELYERPDESEIGTQTDYFLERPATPPYFHGKTGLDAETQISPGDLFDYDVEVQPILEILVGKTIEQALIEVLEEEEQTALREQQRRFEELRAVERAEQQRLEEEERRLRQEKERRVRQHEEALKVHQETEESVAAAVLLTGYIAELLPAVLEELKMSGFLLDEIRDGLDEGFIPWLMSEVKREMGTVMESRELLMEIIKEILENRARIYKKLGEDYDASREMTSGIFDYRHSEIGENEGEDIEFSHYQSPNAIP